MTVASGIAGALALCARDALPLELLAGSAPRAGEGRVGKEPGAVEDAHVRAAPLSSQPLAGDDAMIAFVAILGIWSKG